MKKTRLRWNRLLAFLAFMLPLFGVAEAQVPTPKEHFGFNIGDDYHLANYTQTESYFKKLAETSDRIKLVDIGETEEGRRQYMLIASSPENLKNLDRYQQISRSLAQAELSEEEARRFAKEGKPVVWIDGGLHSSETVAMQQLIQLAFQLAHNQDEETKFILDNTIVLLVHANPDGQEMVSNWYMRHEDPKKRSLDNRPTMYHKYIGHDNNRDFFMLNMKESQNIARQLFVEWVPQIMYNHHQTAPAGAVVAGAPYRDPHNYVFDPLLMTSIDALGAAMHSRLNREGKTGYTQRDGSVFSTWYNGGLRTTTYFHNIVGLLTETIGGPTPSHVPLVPHRLLPNGDTPNPVTPQPWHFQQSIDYSMSMNYAVLNYAARHGDELLYNIYRMGRNSIEKGSKDTWSFSPTKVEAIRSAALKEREKNNEPAPTGRNAHVVPTKHFAEVMSVPENRDPRGYIIPANQSDFPTAVKFLNALIRTGVKVQRATAAFTVAGKSYPAGSYIVKTAQAFRPHVLDMFEPQDHPNDFKYEGGPPTAPYDAAGWTPAYLMNVSFDRFLDDFNGPFEALPVGELLPVPSSTIPSGSVFSFSSEVNDSYKVVNHLLDAGAKVYRLKENGDFIVETNNAQKQVLSQWVAATGAPLKSARKPSASSAVPVKKARIGLWDNYGGSMPSGWIRWINEQYNFDFNQVFAQEIDAGNLIEKYDVLVFVGGAIPSVNSNASAGRIPNGIPEEHHFRWGRITAKRSIPALKEFVNAGGKIITIGSSANLAYHFDLPVKNALVELVDGRERTLPNEKYYTPGSVLRVKTVENHQATWGMGAYTDVYFDKSPVFKFTAGALDNKDIQPLLWFDTDKPLKSGWSWGQSYLKDGIAAFQATVGKGKVYVFGPEITFRAQAHGTFKLMFNQLYK